jgi:hypothetical protein
MASNRSGGRDFSWAVFVIVAAAVVAVWWLFGYVVGPSVDTADPFSAVAALFSGLAFAGVILAILLQRQELRLQRQELRDTRQELEKQRVALEEQVKASKQQRFDSTLFQMLSLHHQIVGAIEYRGKHGRPAMQEIFSEVALAMSSVEVTGYDRDETLMQTYVESLRRTYQGKYHAFESLLGHYFRNMYRVLKYVHESDVADKRTYTGLLRAQLSVSELGLVFYNLYGAGFDKFLPLIIEYDFLEHLPATSLPAPVADSLIDFTKRSRGLDLRLKDRPLGVDDDDE